MTNSTDLPYISRLRDASEEDFITIDRKGAVIQAEPAGVLIEQYDEAIKQARMQGAELFRRQIEGTLYVIAADGKLDGATPEYRGGFYDALRLITDTDIAPIDETVIDFSNAPS